MDKLLQDFSDLQYLITQFIKQKSIRDKLFFITKSRRNDWEKWFQIEFAYYLHSLSLYEVHREITAHTDKEGLDRAQFVVDILYRQKGTNKKRFVFVEIKCTRSTPYLIRGLNRDREKLESITTCKFSQRSSWCVGFHRYCETNDITAMTQYVSELDFARHQLIKICGCGVNTLCKCKNNFLGVAIVFCGAGQL